jgi:pimeloyl-ACP methyl ester carboxylesterase
MNKTIMMIHGMGVGGWIWGNYKEFFEQKGYPCLTPILRYHDQDPQSPPHPQLGTTSILDYADDLENEIRKLDEKPILVGHSMGGLIAQILGSRGLASALVLLCPAAPAGISMFKWSIIKGSWRTMGQFAIWRKPFRPTFDEVVYSILNRIPVEQRRALYDKLGYESGRAMWEIACWFLDSKKTTKIDASKITSPVLAIAGSEDRVTPASVVKKIAEKYGTKSTYKEFPDYAHYMIGEPGWEQIAQDIHEWLQITSVKSSGHQVTG